MERGRRKEKERERIEQGVSFYILSSSFFKSNVLMLYHPRHVGTRQTAKAHRQRGLALEKW